MPYQRSFTKEAEELLGVDIERMKKQQDREFFSPKSAIVEEVESKSSERSKSVINASQEKLPDE